MDIEKEENFKKLKQKNRSHFSFCCASGRKILCN